MILIKNARIVNENEQFIGAVLIKGEYIKNIWRGDAPVLTGVKKEIDLNGKFLLPGIIDDQVHFREPGLTHKANIHSESVAAVAGGITSFLEMPNTNPQTTTETALIEKLTIAAKSSVVNYGFYFGATNDNFHLLKSLNTSLACGVKVFMGSSTGNMLVDNEQTLRRIFEQSPLLIATHCEDEATIRENNRIYSQKYGTDIAFRYHPEIRSHQACYLSSSLAVNLAKEYNAHLHVLHLSTKKEMELFRNDIPLSEKHITAEVCVHHLWFNDTYYDSKGSFIKWNPAIKSETDRLALIDSLNHDYIDVVATDHAPHTYEEKMLDYWKAPSGGPMVQHALVTMLELVKQKALSLEKLVQKMCHNPAVRFSIAKRGFIREGYFADLVVVDLENEWTVQKDNILYKCGWSPLEAQKFSSKVLATVVNGYFVHENGIVDRNYRARKLDYIRK
jgi:dihydroorotase